MAFIPAHLRRAVVERAHDRCEYCLLSQDGQEARFHVDHVVPRAADGETELENLALACVACSLHKAARQVAVDPTTGTITPLFNPRKAPWDSHFAWQGLRLIGLTATGRATIDALRMNRPRMLAIRNAERVHGRHPPANP